MKEREANAINGWPVLSVIVVMSIIALTIFTNKISNGQSLPIFFGIFFLVPIAPAWESILHSIIGKIFAFY